jgi:predicted phage terminase large subunit-like protein
MPDSTFTPDYSFTTKETDPYTHLTRLKSDFKYYFCHILLESYFDENWKDTYKFSPSFLVQCDYINACISGKISDLAVSLPPRNSKSLIWSVGLPTFLWLRNPAETIISVSHSDDVLLEFAAGRKRIYEHKDYQKLITWKLTNNSQDTTRNSAGGHILTMVISAVRTGLGANWIISDDLISAAQGENPNHCKAVRNKYTRTLTSRLNNKVTGHMLVISQRVAESDTIDLAIKAGYTYLELQAIAEEDQVVNLPYSGKKWHRPIGDILNPEHEPLDVLMKLKTQDEEAFQCQYQQRPIVVGNTLLKIDELRRYQKPREQYISLVMSVDSAGTVSSTAANWGIIIAGTWTEPNGNLSCDILYAEAKQYEYPSGKRRLMDLYDEWKLDLILIEKESTGIALIPDLLEQGYKVKAVKPKGDKMTRFLAMVPLLNQGRVRFPDIDFLPHTSQWVAMLAYELLGFPRVTKKDLVDSLGHMATEVSVKKVDLASFFSLG